MAARYRDSRGREWDKIEIDNDFILTNNDLLTLIY